MMDLINGRSMWDYVRILDPKLGWQLGNDTSFVRIVLMKETSILGTDLAAGYCDRNF